MDSDGNSNLQNGTVEDGGSRIRTQSECSAASDNGEASNMDKRSVEGAGIFIVHLIVYKRLTIVFK